MLVLSVNSPVRPINVSTVFRGQRTAPPCLSMAPPPPSPLAWSRKSPPATTPSPCSKSSTLPATPNKRHWSFTILNLDQHSGKECHQHQRYRQYPRNWESQLEVLAHLRAGQSKREPQCWGERRDEGADDVADNQCCSSTEAGDVISCHGFLDNRQHREVVSVS